MFREVPRFDLAADLSSLVAERAGIVTLTFRNIELNYAGTTMFVAGERVSDTHWEPLDHEGCELFFPGCSPRLD